MYHEATLGTGTIETLARNTGGALKNLQIVIDSFANVV